MASRDPFGGSEELREIISRLWTTPEHAEWAPKTDVISLSDLREWMESSDIEILGFASATIHNRRFRIEPPLSTEEYVSFEKSYHERCLRDNPDGEWSDSRYSAGHDLVNIFSSLWADQNVPRPILAELKDWLGNLYKNGDADIRTCIVQATLEHLFEQKALRTFFSDWQGDSVLRIAYDEACLWPDGGGSSPLCMPPQTRRGRQ
ncbi:MAG TPA: hypothetical protein VNK23_00120 [Candidatus Dormibacteraeota bacterium]|nr:hypothetical protein [Candidatus Dormibacteraeota bacterium]